MVPMQAARDEQGERRQEEHRGRNFTGAPVFTPDGVATDVCFARALRGDRTLVVTTSHGPPGAAATTITHRRRPAALALRLVLENGAGYCLSALEELLMLPELRDAVLQWLPCCDLFRARRVSRRFFVWADAALAAQRSPAIIGNAKRDYSGLEFMQQLDPRRLAFKLVGPAAPSSSATAPTADDCAQRGGQIFALRGSALFAAQLPAPDAAKQKCSPLSPAVEQVSSPERTPRRVELQTPQKVGVVAAEVVGTPASPEHLKAPTDLQWDEVLQIPKAGVGQHGRERAFERLRVGGRLCVDHDGTLLLIGGGVEQTAAEPPLVAREQLDIDGVGRAPAEAVPTTVLGVTAQVLRVDPSTGVWQRLPDLLEVRRDCVVAMLPNGAILVAGGAGMHGALSSAEVLGPDRRKWAPLPPMLHARTSASAVALPDGRVAVIGGHKRGRKPYSYRFHSSVEVFDPSSASWSLMEAIMKVPRASCLAGLLGGARPGSESIVVAGGWAGPFRHTCTEVYDHSTQLWRALPNGEVQGKTLGGSMVYLPESD